MLELVLLGFVGKLLLLFYILGVIYYDFSIDCHLSLLYVRSEKENGRLQYLYLKNLLFFVFLLTTFYIQKIIFTLI